MIGVVVWQGQVGSQDLEVVDTGAEEDICGYVERETLDDIL